MDPIILKRFDSPVEANIVKGLLDANEIFCFLQDEHSIGLNILYSNALGGIKLMIRKEDEEQALLLLQSNTAANGLQCPQCKSIHLHYITEQKNKTNWFFIALSFFWMSPFYLKKQYKCSDCGGVVETE
jgi:DNA-directed RNA polymerase subunit RPC12/RpoP